MKINFSGFKCLTLLLLAAWCFQGCELSETCASCIDPDFTVFVLDTTSAGFSAQEIDSFYIIRFPRGELGTPLDTTNILVDQNPFSINGGLFGTSSLNHDYVVEGINREFKFEITDLNYTIRNSRGGCDCDLVENKSLRVDGNLMDLPDPFEPILLGK